MKLFAKLMNNKPLYPFIMAAWSCRSREIRDRVWGIRHDKNEILIRRLGDNNRGKILYNIYMNGEDGGFFALMRWISTALLFADNKGFVPYVKLGSKCRYYDKDITITDNVFEYYFSPVSDISEEEMMSSMNVVDYEKKQLSEIPSYVYSAFTSNPEIIDTFAYIWGKYIHINEKTQVLLDRDIASVIDETKKTIAVHVRGTDFKLQYDGHPIAASLQEEIDAVKKMVDQDGYEKIFLATDEKATVDAFIEEFGDMVSFYDDTYRSTDGTAVHDSNDTRHCHKYLLGYEVLRDAYTMASCQGLVAGVSNVSFFSTVMNKALFTPYYSYHICDHGVNNKGKTYSAKRVKK